MATGSAAVAAPAAATAPAVAAAPMAATADSDGYRYWSFWQQKKDGSWSYATEGPATLRPEDGDTVGFRFALSTNSQQADTPRGAVSFADACARTAAKEGSKRVAVRVDFGVRADAPKGESRKPPAPRTGCARIPGNGTAADALAKVAGPLRYNSEALLCAIDRYPAKGCGEQAKEGDGSEKNGEGGSENEKSADTNGTGSSDRSSDRSSDGGGGGGGGLSTGLGLTAGVAAVGILGAAALWQARRRKQ
ncbi:SCO2322 family protein [Streptomyces spirodelae]|uniref:Secreted protein n=1 Tax=Streptomyces spirodelae TaxID=2812904 RepID=A0ABS3WN19_9ACTN|nr:hypothetical protein [Streptomyces spirodelae]